MQLNACPAGIAAFGGCIGSACRRAWGIGQALLHKVIYLISGIKMAGLDGKISGPKLIQESVLLEGIPKVIFPRDSDGKTSGCGMR